VRLTHARTEHCSTEAVEQWHQVLAAKVLRKMVKFDVLMTERDQREMAYVYLGHQNINEDMVRKGCAWRYAQHDTHRVFDEAEKDAREHRRGLWADPHPVPPWEFRRAKREARK
jgi:micrococcal nuclease